MTQKDDIILYQTKDGAIELREDLTEETVCANQSDIAEIFGVDRTVITKHIGNIFKDDELDKKVVCAKFAHTTQHWALSGKTQTKSVDYYNLDIILAVGYRVNSSIAIKFRQWATKTLKKHIVDGYTINPSRIQKNYDRFMQAMDEVKKLLPAGSGMEANDAIDLVKMFAGTWFSLDAYDKSELPHVWLSRTQVAFTADELENALATLKASLIEKWEATELFAQEKQMGNLAGIIGNVMQSVFGEDAYPTLEEKAAHLLYFVIKNHPFNDGNKRSGAFAFVWLLQRAGILDISRISPEALTALALLIAESNPKDKERMIGLVMLLLNSGK
jgi:prophage maintenance system killer protein